MAEKETRGAMIPKPTILHLLSPLA